MAPSDYRHSRTGSLNIHASEGRHGHGTGQMGGNPRFEGPRSPPNTSHVPCKFFRQGICQAGSACPFSHEAGSGQEIVCKYFAKGNCKFGPKCANMHVLPDGRRVNYPKNGHAAPRPLSLGGRVNPSTYHQSSNSALTNSFMHAENAAPYYAGSYMAPGDTYPQQMDNGLPTIETNYSSNPASAYGSPRDDESNRFGFGVSSPLNNQVLSIMDAPLPASFDPNGISHAARYGPFPASVPSKFSTESPSSSLHNAKTDQTSETLKLLHTSAFGHREKVSPSALALADTAAGSSPPTFGVNDEYFGKRPLHSSSQRYAKPHLMSSSAPKVDRDWDTEFFFEEDYVPGALANEVLTPQEKARRGSMRLHDGEGGGNTPPASIPKFGSPSRWGALFQKQREEELESGSLGRSMKNTQSAFGHVGSPLRNSSLAVDTYNERGANLRAPSSGSLSVLTQQLQRSKLSDDSGSASIPHLHPNAARNTLPTAIGKEKERERGLERHISSGSVGTSATGRHHAPIDEEDPQFLFAMEEEDDSASGAKQRRSAGASAQVWNYASVAAGKHRVSPLATEIVDSR